METQDSALERLSALRGEINKVVKGQDAVITGLVIGLIAGGHVLLEGVPGVAKTLTVRALSAGLSLKNTRVQFTPDLMPGDLTGSLIFNSQSSTFTFREGPVFTNLLLADEINRTPPKTQSALLEAMEEHQVSIDGVSRELPDPFMVIATQNPVEYEGTYPLPEAQLDRFLLKLEVPLPTREAELEVVNLHLQGFNPHDLAGAGIHAVASAEDIAAAKEAVKQVEAGAEVLGYIVDLVRATRHLPQVELGVSPRGATALLATSRVWAWLCGRNFVTPDDVKSLVLPTFRHRLRLRAEAEMEGVTAQSILDTVLSATPVPR
ncbi:MAG: MoxR family ATPase [Mobiluncus porci]|uniref:AAA family ATPase n=1 Tax=Mobiluncus porci TaxID=2652278 RepID=UPI0023F4C4CA|nr:MoxR family ATPase [Mobiluncus porci]MDD7542009.1 MoxR family ATPase [Mobiluncus porci]MDY5747631.1 MoxR family ATPase [Mobiluncus porci]